MPYQRSNIARSIGGAVLLLTIMIAPSASAEYQISADSIYRHIAVLAHDSLEGRQVGEPGEWKAAQYIISVFRQAGLQPKGTDGYLQPFEFTKAIELGEDNRLSVNGVDLKIYEEFTPLRQSASLAFSFDEIVDVGYGIVADEEGLDYDDYAGLDVAGKAVLIRRFTPAVDDSIGDGNAAAKLDRYGYLSVKINTAIEHKAAGVFLITPEGRNDTLTAVGPTHINPKEIPIIFLRRKALERLGLELSNPEITSVEGRTELIKTHDTAYNVVGYIPAANDTTVIIGAHYDHLGWGAENSRYKGDEPMIHNGADDNGSGSAAVLELGRYFTSVSDRLRYSLLFIAFTGEEAGILGSTHYAKHMTVDSSKVRMMVNLDMVGRLRDQEGLVVFGTGSAAEFKDYFDSLEYDKFKIISKESGIGASDHTAFYNRKIPVLFFFTGAHEDYHRPSDDIDKIDFDGIANVAELVADVVGHFDSFDGVLTYQKTKSDGRSVRGHYTVTLGVVPDFIAEVKGLKVDGVSADRPGERAGIKEGDIIIKMGGTSVGDIYDYTGALGKFQKGDSTEVVVVRGADTLSLQVLFE